MADYDASAAQDLVTRANVLITQLDTFRQDVINIPEPDVDEMSSSLTNFTIEANGQIAIIHALHDHGLIIDEGCITLGNDATPPVDVCIKCEGIGVMITGVIDVSCNRINIQPVGNTDVFGANVTISPSDTRTLSAATDSDINLGSTTVQAILDRLDAAELAITALNTFVSTVYPVHTHTVSASGSTSNGEGVSVSGSTSAPS